MWTKERIHQLLDQNENAVWRAVLAIYDLQTADEKNAMATTNANSVGFSAFDAEFMSDIAVKLRRGWNMSPKQLACCRNKIRRYHRQLCEIANAKTVGQAVAHSAVDEEEAEFNRMAEEAESIQATFECEPVRGNPVKK